MISLRREKNVSIISNFLLLLIMHFLVIKEYAIFQNYHYELSRYLYHIKSNKGYCLYLYCLLFIFVIKFDFLFIIFALPFLALIIKKSKLSYTNRVKRVICLNLLISVILMVLNLIKYIYIFSFFYLCFLHFISCLLG